MAYMEYMAILPYIPYGPNNNEVVKNWPTGPK